MTYHCLREASCYNEEKIEDVKEKNGHLKPQFKAKERFSSQKPQLCHLSFARLFIWDSQNILSAQTKACYTQIEQPDSGCLCQMSGLCSSKFKTQSPFPGRDPRKRPMALKILEILTPPSNDLPVQIQYLLVFIDCFSRRVEAFCTRTEPAQIVA